jgi:hypothetical protein
MATIAGNVPAVHDGSTLSPQAAHMDVVIAKVNVKVLKSIGHL